MKKGDTARIEEENFFLSVSTAEQRPYVKKKHGEEKLRDRCPVWRKHEISEGSPGDK